MLLIFTRNSALYVERILKIIAIWRLKHYFGNHIILLRVMYHTILLLEFFYEWWIWEFFCKKILNASHSSLSDAFSFSLLLCTAVTWLKYFRYGVQLYPINQSFYVYSSIYLSYKHYYLSIYLSIYLSFFLSFFLSLFLSFYPEKGHNHLI